MNLIKKIILIFAVFYTGYIMFAIVYYLRSNSTSAQNPLNWPVPDCRRYKNIFFHEKCGNKQPNTYRRANFHCYDGSQGEFKSRYCLDEVVFSRAAAQSCSTISKCLLTPTIGPSIYPTPTPIVVDDCVWCGSDCVNGPLQPGQICNEAFPPNGYECKRVAGICQAIKPPVSTVPCPSPPRCGPGGNLITGDPALGSGTVCPKYFCQYPSPIPN